MPDGFQAEPPHWSPRSPAYHRYAEVNLRKPDKQGSRVPWAIIAVAAAVLSVGLIAALMFSVLMWPTAPMPPAMPVTAAASSTTRSIAALFVEDQNAEQPLEGTWMATAATIDGEEVADDVVAKVRLTMNAQGFQMLLPGTEKKGSCWVTPSPTAKGRKALLFLADTDLRAIYEIDGDTLKMCISDEYPDDFTAKKGSHRILLMLKRQEQEP
jgi:uncharacterized protein (TIGR03067 family)